MSIIPLSDLNVNTILLAESLYTSQVRFSRTQILNRDRNRKVLVVSVFSIREKI